ncbi:MAG: DUF4397 domain-containing protein [Flavihumibacter sp.]|nr:DUF4397 domain-containing protein [Flavihumibacter sp.]
MINNRRAGIILLLFCILVAGCKKEAVKTAPVVIYNATHSATAITASWNGSNFTTTALSTAQASGVNNANYISLPAGTNNLLIQNNSTSLLNKNVYTAAGNGYTILVYDTGAASNTTKVLQLKDDLTTIADSLFKFRFLYCMPDTTPLNLIISRSNGKSDTITNRLFIGREAVASAVEVFANNSKADSATIRLVKASNYQQVLALPVQQYAGNTAYSIIYSGKPAGTGAAIPALKLVTHKIP